jgi:uncharacterized membrane protein YobD (UPF0266 family)
LNQHRAGFYAKVFARYALIENTNPNIDGILGAKTAEDARGYWGFAFKLPEKL